MKKIQIVWVGFHVEGTIAIKSICESAYCNVGAILTLSKEAAEKRSGVFDYEQFASEYDIPFYRIDDINNKKTISLLNELEPDVLCVIGWSQILNIDALRCSKIMTIGAHASKLPHNRGSAPINWSIIHGEKETGNTLIKLAPGVDTGEILAQRSFEISLFDSCKSLYDKVAETNAAMILEVLEKLNNGEIVGCPQPDTNKPDLPRRKPEDGLIDWGFSSKQLYDFIRALAKPYPGAFSYINGKKIFIWDVAWSPEDKTSGKPGMFSSFQYSYKRELSAARVNCGKGQLLIFSIEIEGIGLIIGKEMIEYLNRVEGFDDV